MCENPPSLPPGKGILLSWTRQGGKNTDLQKVCEKPPSLLSRNIFLLFFVQEKGLKNDWFDTTGARAYDYYFFRMTSLGKRTTTIYFRTTRLPQFRAPLRWGIIMGNTMADTHHGCPGGVPCTTYSQKKRLWKGRGHRKVPWACPRTEH